MGLMLTFSPFLNTIYGVLTFNPVRVLVALVLAVGFIVLTVKAYRRGWEGNALWPLAAQALLTVVMIYLAYALDGSHSWRPSEQEFSQTLSIGTWVAFGSWAGLIGLNFKKPKLLNPFAGKNPPHIGIMD